MNLRKSLLARGVLTQQGNKEGTITHGKSTNDIKAIMSVIIYTESVAADKNSDC